MALVQDTPGMLAGFSDYVSDFLPRKHSDESSQRVFLQLPCGRKISTANKL